jgi:hypothetical protein
VGLRDRAQAHFSTSLHGADAINICVRARTLSAALIFMLYNKCDLVISLHVEDR